MLDGCFAVVHTGIEQFSAADETFLGRYGGHLSVLELLRRTGAALLGSARLLSVPVKLLSASAHLMGVGVAAHRLLGSLQVDISKTKTRLGRKPLVSTDERVARTAEIVLTTRGS